MRLDGQKILRMAYAFYTTKAFVLGQREASEANFLYDFFTERFGRVAARAQGVRKLSSKLRYNLQPFARVEVTLVRGREGWRIVGAWPDQFFASIRHERRKRVTFSEVLALLERLYIGERSEAHLFAEVSAAAAFLDQATLGPETLEAYRLLLIFRLVEQLGYAPRSSPLEPFLVSGPWTEQVVESFLPHRAAAAGIIEQALHVSHL